MIILIIALATILTFVTWMLIRPKALRYILGLLSLALLFASVWMLTDHFVNHTGMTIETKTKTREIYSAGDSNAPFGLMIYKEIGTHSSNNVLVYRTDLNQKEAKAHFVPNTKEVTSAVKKSASYQLADVKKATVTKKTKRYVWKDSLSKLLYGFAGENGELISQKSVAKIPRKTWLVLTKEQSEHLESAAAKLKEQMTLQAKVNPVKAMEIKTLAKTNPEAYAEMQVKALKEALNIKE
ncbi:TPA: DUF4811 domain-containing protein [Streptococcus agalactiae]